MAGPLGTRWGVRSGWPGAWGRLACWAVLAVCLPGWRQGMWAQGPVDGVVRGELRDVRGGVESGAAIRLLAEETGRTVVSVADRKGRFGFLGVPAGTYRCQVRFAAAPVWLGSARIVLEAGEDRDLELEWDAASASIRVRVSAGAGILEGTEGTEQEAQEGQGGARSVALNAQGGVEGRVDALPVPGREWEEAEFVQAAARDTTLPGGGAAQDAEEAAETASAREAAETGTAATGLSRDGLPVLTGGESVDGLTADQGFRGGPRGASLGGPRLHTTFAASAVGRWTAGVGQFSAQSRSGGGQLGVVSRGTGAALREGLHASGFAQAREAAWGAVNPFAVVTGYGARGVSVALVRPADSDVQIGAAAGRAVHLPGLPERWRAGLFGAVEGRERRQALWSTPETAGFFFLSGNQKALLANRGVSSAQQAAALAYLSGLTGPEVLRGSQWLGFGRVDLEPGRRDRLSVGYQAQRMNAPATAGGQVAEGVVSRGLGSVGSSVIAGDAGSVRWVHTFGPHWVNEVRAQAVRDLESEAPGGGSAAVPGVGPGGLAPQVTIGPEDFRFGTPATLGRVAYPDERRLEAAETTVWRFGRHVVTLGGDWSRLDDKVLGATNAEGSFLYDSGTTGGYAGGLVDWISDFTYDVHAYPNEACPAISAKVHYFCFRSYSQSFANVEAEFVTHEVAGYAEDALRLGRAVRVTLEARWEYQLLPFPLLPDKGLDAALAGAGSAFGTTASFPEDRNNVGPRATVSWAPGVGRRSGGAWFTVRAGYGMFFGRLPGATLQAALTETGVAQATTRIRITPQVETTCPQVTAVAQGFGYLCSFPYAPLGVAPVAQTRSAVMFSKRFRLPAVQRGSFVLERELGRRVTLRAGYGVAWAVQLPETTDLNIAPSTSSVSYVVQGGDGRAGLWTGQSFQVPLYTARRTKEFGPVTAVESNANATYHSGTAEVVLRGWHGWSGRGSFAFSRAIDYGPQVGASPRQDGQFDPFTDGYDKARSDLDRPWGAAGEVSYRSSVARGGEWRRGLLSGWGMAAVGRAGSGAPYSYTVFGGTRLTGGHESLNGSGGATYLPTVGRNTLRLPMRSKVDVRMAKEVNLGRGQGRLWRMQVHADAFNVLNTVSVSRVETRAFLTGTTASVGGMTPLVFQDAATVATEGVSTPAFGTALSSTTGLSRERAVEFGLRASF